MRVYQNKHYLNPLNKNLEKLKKNHLLTQTNINIPIKVAAIMII